MPTGINTDSRYAMLGVRSGEGKNYQEERQT